MSVLVKVYNSYFSNTLVEQIPTQSLINIEENLIGGGFAKFQLPIFTGLETGAKVEVVRSTIGSDILLFRGVINEIRPIRKNGFDQADIVCYSEDRVLEKRFYLTGASQSGTPKQVIEALLDWYNTTYNENRSVVSSITDNVSIDGDVGDSIFDLVDEIAEQVNAKRTVKEWVLYIDENIGIDRTTGANYQEIVFDATAPGNSNLWEIELSITNTRANVVIANDWSSSVTVSDGWPFFGVVRKRFRPWDLTAKANALLEQVNQPQRVYKVTVEPNTLIANLWDKIKLRVDGTNSFFDVDLSVFVIKKTVEVSNADFLTTYEVSDLLIQQKTEGSVIRNIQKRLQSLET